LLAYQSAVSVEGGLGFGAIATPVRLQIWPGWNGPDTLNVT